MRLIDADKLKIRNVSADYWYTVMGVTENDIDYADTVEAIPVEWIEKYIKQNYCTCDLVYPEEFLKELVTWWEEENARD